MGIKERRIREKEQRRDDILSAARSLLVEKGYYNISMRQIANLSELGVGTIYSYFSSKEEIYAYLSEEVFEIIFQLLLSAEESTDSPVEKIKNIGRAINEFSEKNKMHFDFIDYFISSPQVIFPDDIKSRVDSYGNRVLMPVINAIESGIETGIFRKVDSRIFALIFLGNLQGIIHFKKVKDTLMKNYKFDEIFKSTVENFINGLKHY